MAEIDWNAPTQVQCREDGGSDLYYDFRTLKSGPLAEMVHWTLALPSDERARVVMDVQGRGTLNIHDINALSRLEDFPAV